MAIVIPEGPFSSAFSMPHIRARLKAAQRGLGNDLRDSAHAHWLLHRCKVALHGAGKHVATLRQRKSSLVSTKPPTEVMMTRPLGTKEVHPRLSGDDVLYRRSDLI